MSHFLTRRGRGAFEFTTCAIFLGAIVLLTALAPGLSRADVTAEIASWNLAGFYPIPEERIERIADTIFDLDAELVALCEVNKYGVVDELVVLLEERGATYIAAGKEQDRASQHLAILHKPAVEVSDVELVDGSDLDRRGWREALSANVRVGEFDFALIVVHLKAGRGSRAREGRDDQCGVIAAHIADMTTGDEKDVLVLGDYNMVPATGDESNFEILGADGYLRFISSEELLDEPTHIHEGGTPGNLLDGFAISSEHTGEYIEGTLRVERLYRVFKNPDIADPADLEEYQLDQFQSEVSDHLPLIARFRIDVDDD